MYVAVKFWSDCIWLWYCFGPCFANGLTTCLYRDPVPSKSMMGLSPGCCQSSIIPWRPCTGTRVGSPEGKPVSRETGSHGSGILGQEVLCWQLSFPDQSFQCHSWKAVVWSVFYAAERCSTDVALLACLAVAWRWPIPCRIREIHCPVKWSGLQPLV